jgi:ABC-type glycerol-3-phosphate transport system permease component
MRQVLELKEMFQMNSMVLLVGAVFASLAFGVLMAYGICQTMFRIFRVHAQSAARSSQTAGVSASLGS